MHLKINVPNGALFYFGAPSSSIHLLFGRAAWRAGCGIPTIPAITGHFLPHSHPLVSENKVGSRKKVLSVAKGVQCAQPNFF